MNRSKQKGTAWETAVVRYLQAGGFDVYRKALSGNQDQGDIGGLEGWTLEAKDRKQISLAQFVTEAETEAAHAGTPWYAAIVKRRQKNVADGYVVMPLKVFVGFLKWWSLPVESLYDDDEDGDDGE